MDLLKHLPSPIAPTFSEALRIDTRGGSWIFISGQVGVPLPPDQGSVTFEQEVRTTFERIRDSLGKLGAGMNHVVSIKTYLTDLGPYAVFSRIRGEFFPKRPAHEYRRAGRQRKRLPFQFPQLQWRCRQP
jgi:2-iminobutanoate/2-iminopropanoate deaminase